MMHNSEFKQASVVIVTPGLANANNGNWQTAKRWAGILSPAYKVRVVQQWPDAHASDLDTVMIALHARKSHASIAAWAAARPSPNSSVAQGLMVVLTGTDIYGQLDQDLAAQDSIAKASSVLVLQDQALAKVPEVHQSKTHVFYQSTTLRKTLSKPHTRLKALMVGHLRDEKMPQTYMEAAVHLRSFKSIYLDHIGEALDPEFAEAARQTMAACPNYRWLGGVSHGEARRRIQSAHVLVHCSQMEGGAHVIMEAVCSGTPVIASRIDGNIGMLGATYPAYFELGNAVALANLLSQLEQELLHPSRQPSNKVTLYARMTQAAQTRVPLFAPAREAAELLALVEEVGGHASH